MTSKISNLTRCYRRDLYRVSHDTEDDTTIEDQLLERHMVSSKHLYVTARENSTVTSTLECTSMVLPTECNNIVGNPFYLFFCSQPPYPEGGVFLQRLIKITLI